MEELSNLVKEADDRAKREVYRVCDYPCKEECVGKEGLKCPVHGGPLDCDIYDKGEGNPLSGNNPVLRRIKTS